MARHGQVATALWTATLVQLVGPVAEASSAPDLLASPPIMALGSNPRRRQPTATKRILYITSRDMRD